MFYDWRRTEKSSRTEAPSATTQHSTRSYDDLDRLVSATYPSGRAVSYEYDGAGNRMRMLDDGAETMYRYNAFNQLLDATDPDGTTLFTWDNNGNQTGKVAPEGTTGYTWDARDRLSEVALPDGTTAAYGYDTENLRVSMDDADGARRILLDGLEERGEVDEGSGELTARFDHDPTRIDALLAQATEADGRAAMLTDALGSVYALADDAAALRARYGYDVYGARSATLEEIGTRWGLQARPQLGELTYYRARVSDIVSGRWALPDPMGLLDGVNRYQYLGDNPPNAFDPLGLVVALRTSLDNAYWRAVVTLATGLADPETQSLLREFIAAFFSLVASGMLATTASRAGRWECSATCIVQQIGSDACCPDRVYGTGTGPTEDVACDAAKRSATQSAPRSCYPRHCKCVCSKR